jgi:hypothetical protein
MLGRAAEEDFADFGATFNPANSFRVDTML